MPEKEFVQLRWRNPGSGEHRVHLAAVMGELRGTQLEPQRGESWVACERHRDFIKGKLDEGLLLDALREEARRQLGLTGGGEAVLDAAE